MKRDYVKKTIALSEEERDTLKEFVRKGNNPAMIIRRANVILAADINGKKLQDQEISKLFGVSTTSIWVIKSDYLAINDVNKFLHRKKRETPPTPKKITGEVEAHILAIACSEPPKGYSRWTLKLIAERVVELGYIDSISDHSVGNVLKKANISLT